MDAHHTNSSRHLGHRWATLDPRTAAVLRERRVQIAVDPAIGRHRITMA